MQWHAISMRVEVDWTFRAEGFNADAHIKALQACALAQGRDAPGESKLRVDCQEFQDMGEFVAQYVMWLIQTTEPLLTRGGDC